ncbi:hypothetical protein ABID56_002555 [Alkalibacillus flavidus]|uniref:Uncharacterized protein n=1 Tax=Alkalibacillus flavidus TaxID=546021 RepID=A0ABV2KXW3_9BACI
MKTGKVSIKSINGHLYVYSWQYVPVHLRNNPDSKYRWLYIGPLHSQEVDDFIHSLDEEDQAQIFEMIEERKRYLHDIEKMKQQLLKQEPTKTEYERIKQINNTKNRNKKLHEFDKKLNRLSKKKLQNQYLKS